MSCLRNIRIILVEPSHPGNIGAVARAMKTMCLERLYLVQPKVFPHAEATARASGADDVLNNATLCGSLKQALEGCGLVVASSARRRSLTWPQLSPRKCAHKIVSEVKQNEAAVVFGREQSGLSNLELDHCHYMVYIPSNPLYSSLNLAAAVQILCYELFVASGANKSKLSSDDEPFAEVEFVEQFYEHLENTLIALEFLDPKNPKHLMRRLRRMFNRARLSNKEVNILRGILTAIQKMIAR